MAVRDSLAKVLRLPDVLPMDRNGHAELAGHLGVGVDAALGRDIWVLAVNIGNDCPRECAAGVEVNAAAPGCLISQDPLSFRDSASGLSKTIRFHDSIIGTRGQNVNPKYQSFSET